MTSTVATLIAADTDRISFASTLRRELNARFCADSMELRSLVTAGAVDAIVADLETARRASVWSAIRAAVDPHPAIPVLLWLSLTGRDMRDLVALATETKPDAVIIREIDDGSLIIADAIRSARDGNATRRIMGAIERIVSPSLRTVLVCAARDAERPLTIHRVAASAGLTRRALCDRLAAAGLPSARDVIHWLRLLHVAARLEMPRATVEQVAERMRFVWSGALCQLLRRMTGLTPQQLRDAGGLEYLLGVVEPLFRGVTAADQDPPLVDLGRPSQRLQCPWYESRRSHSR